MPALSGNAPVIYNSIRVFLDAAQGAEKAFDEEKALELGPCCFVDSDEAVFQEEGMDRRPNAGSHSCC